ncbi:sigma-54-dependent Fis family transcriptional regulator [Desulfoplanes sp.]
MSNTPQSLLEILNLVVADLDPLQPLQPVLERVLEKTAELSGYKRITLAIFDPKTDTLKFSVSHGHARPPSSTYAPGEGVTGHVLSTGEPIVVPIMSEEPLFLNRAGGRSHEEMAGLSFVSVPVLTSGEKMEILGVLSADLPIQSREVLEVHKNFLQALARIIARQTAYLQESILHNQLHGPSLNKETKQAENLAKNKIVASSKAMSQVMGQIMQVADSRATVLLRGESGTGKELLAEAIHNMSSRCKAPSIKLNCAALPSELIESELFGYERGAFTGAVGSKKGRFELAHQGTLFLDEIGELSAEAQAKLLRAIQEGEIQRLGSEKATTIDVRIVCATHQPLETLIKDNRFREDLYYRINVFPIYIPALRERRQDILPLAEHFLTMFSQEYGKTIKRISSPAIDLLAQYHWPGNVRELRNCIERATLLCMDEAIRTYHLPPTLQTAESSATDSELSFGESVARFEQELLVEALKKTRGNMLEAARELRSSYRVINYKIKKYGINPKKYSSNK